MQLFQVTAKLNSNPSGAKFTKGMSVEVQTNLLAPFNNSGKEVIAAFVRKYGIDASHLNSLSPNDFDVKKL
jgi:membrane peptidoglycan carboxypeptidase